MDENLLANMDGPSSSNIASNIARGKALKQKRVSITDSQGVKTWPRYTEIDPILLNSRTLLILIPNRAYLVKGAGLDSIADRFVDEAVTVLKPFKSANQPYIESITMHWLFGKTPEQFLQEIVEEKELQPVG